MNAYERQMLQILKEGHEKFGFLSVKAEFEAEGSRHDEFMRLVHIARVAGLKVALKIGGCEAMRDLIESKQYGVDYIIAPMVETPYALQKFIDAKNKIYTLDEQQDCDFLFNLETITGYQNLAGLIKTAAGPNGVDGVVFGRVDFAGSMGRSRDAVDGAEVMAMVTETAKACVANNLQMVTGGAVSVDSIDVLTQLQKIRLTRYETRKVIFDGANLPAGLARDAIVLAGRFELLWLENKQDYYQTLAMEDDKRLKMLKARFA
jgi:methylmalonyl-CoA mutase cobalamin-binding subunit